MPAAVSQIESTTARELPLDPRLLRTIRVDDVTDDEKRLRVAMTIAAENYARISTVGLESGEVYEQLCRDAYHRSGRSRTLLATGYNPSTGAIEPLGTCRCVLGSEDDLRGGLAPLEIMNLIEPLDGWECFSFENFQRERAVELGRFAISRRAREGAAKIAGLPLGITRRLLEAGIDLARSRGRDQAWGIMPGYMVRRLTAAGFHLSPAPRMRLRRRENDELFRAFSGYWIDRAPTLYRIRILPLGRFGMSAAH